MKSSDVERPADFDLDILARLPVPPPTGKCMYALSFDLDQDARIEDNNDLGPAVGIVSAANERAFDRGGVPDRDVRVEKNPSTSHAMVTLASTIRISAALHR